MHSEHCVSAISGVAAHAKCTQEVRYAACFLASGQQKSLMKRQFCLLQLHNRMSGNSERVGTFGLSVGFRFAMMRPTSHP